MAKFSEDLYDAQGNYVKTVEWTKMPSQDEYVQVMHAPTWPIDPEYARKYEAWVRSTEANIRAGWVQHYRGLTSHELVAATLSLRIAHRRGHATNADIRFEVLEAEQAFRAEYPIRFAA